MEFATPARGRGRALETARDRRPRDTPCDAQPRHAAAGVHRARAGARAGCDAARRTLHRPRRRRCRGVSHVFHELRAAGDPMCWSRTTSRRARGGNARGGHDRRTVCSKVRTDGLDAQRFAEPTVRSPVGRHRPPPRERSVAGRRRGSSRERTSLIELRTRTAFISAIVFSMLGWRFSGLPGRRLRSPRSFSLRG